MYMDTQPILAIDTSTQYLSLGLQIGESIIEIYELAGNHQAELILPKIQELLNQANIQVKDLAAIVYAQGPGAFTGLRIGIGVAKGLATPFNIPLIAIPTLDAIAYQNTSHQYVLAAMDARMGEVFYAWFDVSKHQRLTDYQVGKANKITFPENIDVSLAIGLGNAYLLSTPPSLLGRATMPTAKHYLQLAMVYPTVDIVKAELLYVRDKIALTAKEQVERKNTQVN